MAACWRHAGGGEDAALAVAGLASRSANAKAVRSTASTRSARAVSSVSAGQNLLQGKRHRTGGQAVKGPPEVRERCRDKGILS
eukprot:1195931-Prorocentrum_minimum.AAC.5